MYVINLEAILLCEELWPKSCQDDELKSRYFDPTIRTITIHQQNKPIYLFLEKYEIEGNLTLIEPIDTFLFVSIFEKANEEILGQNCGWLTLLSWHRSFK